MASTILADRFELHEGSELGPNYVVVKPLGEGTFGLVYLVRSKRPPIVQKAAKVLKLYNNPPNIRKEVSDRFNREFECGQIRSKYLVAATERGEIKGNPFFIMDYCAGGSMKELIGSNLNYQAADKLTGNILLGLERLHKSGIIHRDIKPDNILLNADHSVAKLTDFGIAGYQNSRLTKVNLLGHAKGIFGTYAYIAPEQANSTVSFKTMGPTADFWSLGVSLFEVLTGKYPFGTLNSDADLADYLKNAQRGQRRMLREFRRDTPPRWEEFISRCLEVDHKRRLSSSEEAMDILEISARSNRTTRPNSYNFHADLFGLQVMHGEEPNRIYNLSRAIPNRNGTATIGWYDAYNPNNNTLTIVERLTSYISRYHATLYKDDYREAWLIKDGQERVKNGQNGWYPSTNGTFVNGTRLEIDQKELRPDDIITIGDTTLKVVIRRQ